MSTLKLCKNPDTGAITSAYIDDKRVDGFVSVTQTLERGILKATITATFDSVDTCPEEAVVVSAPALTAVFMAGVGAGATKALIADIDAEGNHFAYKVLSEPIEAPVAGDIADGTTVYLSGADIPGVDVATNKVVVLYELTADNKVVKFLQHTLTELEITQAVVPEVKPVPSSVDVIAADNATSVAAAGTLQFTATVKDASGAPMTNESISWAVNGGTTGTSIDATGLLTVSADESVDTTLVVTATVDGTSPAVTGSVSVTVTVSA